MLTLRAMAEVEAGKVVCAGCDRRYTWRPELAGKRVKCKCGGQVDVPRISPRQSLDDVPAAVATALVATPPRPAPIAYPSAKPTREEKREQNRFTYDNLLDAKRDIYIPTVVLVIGTLGLLAWAIVEAQAYSFGVALFGLFILVKTLIKTAIVVGLAILIAPAAGLSFGGLWSAILKLAAIIVFADALLMWFEALLEHLGAMPSGSPTFGRRNGWWLVGLMKTLLTAAFIGIQLRFMFDMDSEEVGQIAVPMAFVNRILDFVLMIALLAALDAALGLAVTPAPAVPVPTANSPAGGASPPAVQGNVPPPTREQSEAAAADAEIRQKANHNQLVEGTEWSSTILSDREKRTKTFIQELYAAGATKVWVDKLSRGLLYVELPRSPDARKAVLGAATVVSPNTPADVGQRYLVVQKPATNRK